MLSEPSDEVLVERVLKGDRSAREDLFRRHRDTSFRVAVRYLHNSDDAMDAVQEGFVKIFLRLDKFKGQSSFRTWLHRIMVNAAFDVGRRKARRAMLRLSEFSGDADDAGTTPSSPGVEPSVEDDPSHGLRREDLRETLQQAFDALSPTIRETFLLHVEAGLSYQEIAESLNKPIGTVMSRIHQARKKLQAFLGPLEEIL